MADTTFSHCDAICQTASERRLLHKLKLFNCYTHIRDLKEAKRANRERGEDFFPGLSVQGVPINTRQEADSMVHGAVKRIQAERAAGR